MILIHPYGLRNYSTLYRYYYLYRNRALMVFEALIPILYSADIERSLNYYIDVLGFDEKWVWDEPATFGGVNAGPARIFFCLNDQGHPGTWICISVEDVDSYYETIKAKGAKIIMAPQDRPWFLREMLVEDPHGI
jgi:predicted enzyme related to lactoylglutathione lyase